MSKKLSDFGKRADGLVGEHFVIIEVPGELHFWCRNCVKGWRHINPRTVEELTDGSLAFLGNHAASHQYKATAKKAAR